MEGRSETSVSTSGEQRAERTERPVDDRARGRLDERLAAFESPLLSFGRALGGDPDTLGDLPFTRAAGSDGRSGQPYVRHHEALLDRLSGWLRSGHHVALCSGPGTGKSALASVLARDRRRRGDVVVALDDPGDVTARGLYERVLRAAADAGYEVDPDDYWQVQAGIPWRTDGTKRAVAEVARAADADGRRVLLRLDRGEDLDADLQAAVRTVGDAGVQLFLLGRPEARRRFRRLRSMLDAGLRYAEGIEPFGPEDVAEYVDRSLSQFATGSDAGPTAGLFSGDAIEYVLAETGGNPRAVRRTCLDLFVRAAHLWDEVDVPVERVTVTAALADRDLGVEVGDGATGN